MNRASTFIFSLVYLATQGAFAQDHVDFKLPTGVTATATLQDGKLIVAQDDAGGRRQSFDLQLPEAASVAVRHINQDAFPDLEVWHTDEGMGTYTIHYLFVYSIACHAFVQLTPKHTDVFMNLRLGRPGAALRYSGYEIRANRWREYSQAPDPSIELTNCSKLQSAAPLERGAR